MNKKQDKLEYLALLLIIVFIITQAIINKEYFVATISAICGISYSMLAGKGNPKCYFIGLSGSAFYSLLAFQNALWGNLALYLFYYIPMQILGYFKWRKNLKKNENTIVKTKVSIKERMAVAVICAVLILITTFFMEKLNDKNPLLDATTTILSLAGMYFTVKRAIEQWSIWMIVNFLSAIMWIKIAFEGQKVYSTVIMWVVYLFLAIYFYIKWKKEIETQN